MSVTQLNPALPVWVEERGEGYAILVTDYSQEHHKIWTIVFNDNGQIWDVANPYVRVQWNRTLGREPKYEPYEATVNRIAKEYVNVPNCS